MVNNNGDLKTVLSFFDFYSVTRACKPNQDRFENNAEHSWFIVYLFFYLQPSLETEFNCKLDTQKILTLAAIHDIGELNIGDVPTWKKQTTDKESELIVAKEELVTKMNRPDLYNLYLELEDKNPSLEVQIVRSLDRLSPVLVRIYSKIGWHDVKERSFATRKKLDERSISRHKFSKTILNLYNEAVEFALAEGLIFEEVT